MEIKMSVIIAHATGKTTNQERLEAIFHAVDSLKSDLNKTGMGIDRNTEKISCIEAGPAGLICRYRFDGKLKKVKYWYDAKKQTLNRAVNSGKSEILMGEVTEVAKKEQVRGYIFLLNLAN
jgi:hypothetical protein